MAGFGNVNLKVRPLRLAFLVEPKNKAHIKDAMALSSTLWGGVSFPIIPIYSRMPKTWGDGPIKPPKAKEVISGYIEAFDPDVIVNFSEKTPEYLYGHNTQNKY